MVPTMGLFPMSTYLCAVVLDWCIHNCANLYLVAVIIFQLKKSSPFDMLPSLMTLTSGLVWYITLYNKSTTRMCKTRVDVCLAQCKNPQMAWGG